jgi:hypothetical protein
MALQPQRLRGWVPVLLAALTLLATACGGSGSTDARLIDSTSTAPSSGGSGSTSLESTSTTEARLERDYPAGGPIDPVFPPGDEAYRLLSAGKCDELLTDTDVWVAKGVPAQEGVDTTPLYRGADRGARLAVEPHRQAQGRPRLHPSFRAVVGALTVPRREHDLGRVPGLDGDHRQRHRVGLLDDRGGLMEDDPATEPPATETPAEETPGEDTAGDDITSSVPVKSLQGTVRGLLSIVAPTTLVVGLLYYFGWARTSAEAHALSLDDSLFGYSSQDYILRSISSMYWPLFVGAIVLLVGLVVHGVLSAWFGDDPTDAGRVRWGRALTVALAVIGVALLTLGILGAHVTRPSRFVSLAGPIAVTASIVVLAYAVHLLIRFGPGLGSGPLARESKPFAPLAWSLVIVMLFLSLFWTVSHYAGIRGVDLAIQAERQIPRQPSVTIYSARRLYLEPPVQETELPDQNAAYRYRYTGLKLLFRSEHNYFLRTDDPRDPRNIIIAEAPDLRFEFTPS